MTIEKKVNLVSHILTVIMVGKIAKVLAIILLASILCYVEISSKELYVIIPNTHTCKILDHNFVKNATCISKNVNRTTNFGSTEIIYQPGVLITNQFANIVMYRKFATIYRQFMIDINVDICALNDGIVSNIAKVLNIDRRRKYGNLHDPCPISGRRYEKNVPFDYSSFPDIVPAGEYRIDITTYTFVNDIKRKLILMQKRGEAKTTTAEYWKR